MKSIQKNEILNMDFSSLVALVREPNMCSGGRETIRTIINESNIKESANILEVGSNTGFSSIEFATVLPNSQVTGIDINPISVEFAKNKAKNFNVTNVEFIHSDALELPFGNNSFDVVFVSNVTSFIDEKQKAINEYLRVLKPGGMLVVVPIYYKIKPPENLVKNVEKAINAKLNIWDKEFWKNLFMDEDLYLYFEKDFKYIESKEEEINQYVQMVMTQDHINEFDIETRTALSNKLKYFYELFDENLKFAGFSILTYKYNDANNIPILHKSVVSD